MSNIIRNTKYFLPLLLFVVLVIFLWQGLKRDPHELPSPYINKPLPHFSAQTLLKPTQSIDNQVFIGHVSLLNVFATWCLSCRAEHPVLMDIKNSHQVRIYGLNYKDDRKEAIRWLKQFGNPYVAVIDDPRGQVGIDLGVYGTPETFVIDRRGKIRYKYTGPVSPDKWRDEILPQVMKLQREV